MAGQRRSMSAGSMRSIGTPMLVRVLIEWPSKPSSRWANQSIPHST